MLTTLHTQEQADTIVVGGGLAGLATATYLARADRRVTVLEKGSQTGGRAISDTRDGYTLNRGAHALYSGGPASEILKELGITYTAGIPKGVMALNARGLHRFPADAMSMLQTSLLSAGEKFELLTLFSKLAVLDASQWSTRTVEDWLAASTHGPNVRAVFASTARSYLYSTALDVASADNFLARLQQTLKAPVHYIAGGWQSLADSLAEAARAAGVDIRPASTVAGITFDNQRVTSVDLHDGSQLRADTVVFALPLAEANGLLADTPLSELLTPYISGSLPVPVACLDVALSKLPRPNQPIVMHLEQPLFATAQSAFTPVAPAGGAVIHAFKQLDARALGDPHQDRDDLERFLDTIQPGWREYVVERHYLPRISGASALPLAASNGLHGRAPAHFDAAPNLSFCGDWVGPRGWLVDASLNSARLAARAMLASQPEALRVAA